MSPNRESEKIAGLDRNVFFTGLTSFFTDTSVKMIYSVMPLFLLSIGASKTSIALIEGVAESTAALFKVLSGYWSDRISRNKPFLVLGYGITALITPIYGWVRTPFEVLILRFVERVGKGIRTAPRDSLISGSSAKGETGKSFGFHKAMDNSGAIAGPLVAMLLLYLFPANYKIIFILATLPAILGVVNIYLMVHEAKSVPAAQSENFRFRQLPRRYYLFLLVVFVFTLGNSADALLLIKTAETGINPAYIPFVYMLFNLVSVFLAVPLGKISDRIGREILIIAGFALYALVYFLFGRYNSLSVFIVLFILYGFYSALTDGSQKALISDLVGKELKGTGYGLYHAVLGITLLPASLIAGLLYDHYDSSAPFYFGATMAALAAILMGVFVAVEKRISRSQR